jgi:hypothetical protein
VELSPITLFCLSFLIGSLGGLSRTLLRRDDPPLKQYVAGVLWAGNTGLGLALLLYWKLGKTEFGACTLLGLSLLFGMAGRAGFEHLLRAARIYLGVSGSGNGSDYGDHDSGWRGGGGWRDRWHNHNRGGAWQRQTQQQNEPWQQRETLREDDQESDAGGKVTWP